jgi:hypothetical protein
MLLSISNIDTSLREKVLLVKHKEHAKRGATERKDILDKTDYKFQKHIT